MQHMALVKEFLKIASTHRWDDLAELLTPNFHFLTTLNDVKGRENFIEFEKLRSIPLKETTLHIFSSIDDNVYYHIFHLKVYGKRPYEKFSHQSLGIENGLIHFCNQCSSFMPEDNKKTLTPIEKYKRK